MCPAPVITIGCVPNAAAAHGCADECEEDPPAHAEAPSRLPIRKPNPYRRLQRSIRMGSTAANLVNREFESRGPGAVLLTDITYIPLNGKFCYLSTSLDACTKQILAYAMSESLEVDFALEMVEQLVQNYGPSLNKETVIHSDQGTHYTSLKFIRLVESRELGRSVSRRSNCWDNAPRESFFGHTKDELADKISSWTSFADATASIDRWMDYYNQDRCQWDLAKLSPMNFTITSPQVSTPPVCCCNGSIDFALDLGCTLRKRGPEAVFSSPSLCLF
ncbi:IS3 family transposase [Dysosmobacter welbionis]|uniref:IS3 family transposase n=1 Tax=Dysosmobacter welbionis TaxID=2093857 RepID=UPI00338E7F25